MLAVAAIPLGIAASRYIGVVQLLQGLYAGVPAALLLGLLAVLSARRGRQAIARTLGRARGARAARIGHALALLGVYVGLMGALALISYTVLRLYS